MIVGEGCPDGLLASLERLGISVLLCPKNPRVDSRISGHADLSVFHFGGESFLLAKTLRDSVFAEKLSKHGADLIFSDSGQDAFYPRDASLCALSIGYRVFHNKRLSDKELFSRSRVFFNVNQGYAKCAVCPVSPNAAISADKGIIAAMRSSGIDVLEVSPGGASLHGFSEGFIGGAAFKTSADTIACTGSLSLYPDGESVLRFLRKHGVEPFFLSGGVLSDIGSIVPVREESQD